MPYILNYNFIDVVAERAAANPDRYVHRIDAAGIAAFWHGWFWLVLAFAFLLLCALMPRYALIGLLICVVLITALKTVAFLASIALPTTYVPTPFVPEHQLGSYAIFLPVYKESAIVSHLLMRMARLYYPADKLHVHLLVEADDDETRNALMLLTEVHVPATVHIVPQGFPRTKPKAMNTVLPFVRSDYLVIFDAEDIPDTQQLYKAACAFACDPTLHAVQARLEFFNRRVSWLNQLFAFEYDMWFSLIMPQLSRMDWVIPFGGTSIHMRTNTLKHFGGWDPYNVTEDCDLGVRCARWQYTCKMLDSFTAEEAPEHLVTWLKQRTRWLQGYLRTLFVHTRSWTRLYDDLGFNGVIGFLVVIMGTAFTPLLYPLCVTLIFCFPQYFYISQTIVASILLCHQFAMCIIAYKRHDARLLLYAPLLPLYWLACTVASIRAAYRNIRKPYEWEKTTHGLTHASAPYL